ncbi:MAG TPA: SdrD B-like domain-containing protein [Pyrinomonadaceae bacterium]|jgi:hypothetical protein
MLSAMLVAHWLPSAGSAALAPGGQSEALDGRRGPALRVVLFVRGSRAVPFDTPVAGITVVNPEFVTAQASGRTVIFNGVAQGEAMVIITGAGGARRTVVVEVRGRPAPSPAEMRARAERRRRDAARPAGSYALTYSPSLGGVPALLRQTFDYTRKLADGRTVRLAADVFRFFGAGERALARPAATLGLDRVSLGVDSKNWRSDLLDSELNVSPLGLNGYTMRGPHLAASEASRLRGLELFAGVARPALTLFNNSEGYLGGAVLPLAAGRTWRLRAGVLFVAPRGQVNRTSEEGGGLVWQADGRFAPDARTTFEGEAAHARDGFSWRGRAEIRRGDFNLYAESLRFDRRSPLAALGAQTGGRKADALAVTWNPLSRLSATVSYNRAANRLTSLTQSATLDNSTLFAGLNLQLTGGSRLGLRYSGQEVETGAGLASLLQLSTRNFAVAYGARLNRRWSNEFEAGLTASRETAAGSRLERGLSLREELRLSGDGWSATGFFNYRGNIPTATGLVVRNPQLLPPALRRAYEADPARFLADNRDALPALLGGVALSRTRNAAVGLRFQAALARYRFVAESRYDSGAAFAHERRGVTTTFSAVARLDAAHSVRVSGSRSFAFDGGQGRTALTFSFIRRFGIPGGGFGLAKLLGLDRGKVEGRAFLDLDADGSDDPEEPGVAGLTVRLDGLRSATTDARGRYSFTSVAPGGHTVALVSDRLGVSLRAGAATEQTVTLGARQTASVSFGLSNFGSVGGRVFNDLYLAGATDAAGAPGLRGLRVLLRGANVASLTTDASGLYEFRNLAPGSYTLEVDPASLPADFRAPERLSWPMTLSPLQDFFMDIPLAAQRAVSGVVYLDRDGDGRFDPAGDLPLPGARVAAGKALAVTAANGSYLLRGLPAGRITLLITRRDGESREVSLDLSPDPVFSRGHDVGFRP